MKTKVEMEDKMIQDHSMILTESQMGILGGIRSAS